MPTELDLQETKLADRVGPILADGTPLRDLVNLDKREVSFRVYHDAEIHRLELRRVFGRSWHILAHEDEIPNVGDFVMRSIGEDPVIVTRDRDGQINILLNVCAHRGMEVCWSDQGNQSQFKCPYHGWVFDSTGNLLGAPFEQEMYGDWDKSQFGLRTARVATRHGVILGCFEADAPSFEDWLGEMDFYFDEMYGRTDLEVIGPAHRMIVHANWKAACEQFSGDGYHQVSLHKSMGELGMVQADANDAKGWAVDNTQVSVPQGHGIRVSETVGKMWGEEKVRAHAFDGFALNGILFPNSLVYVIPFPKADMSSVLLMGAFGGVSPRGGNSFEYWNVPIAPKSASDVEKAFLRKAGAMSAGIVLPDDVDTFPLVMNGTSGAVGQEQTIKYNALLGPRKPDNWPGPGIVYDGFSGDDPQWQFWLRWFDLMTAPTD